MTAHSRHRDLCGSAPRTRYALRFLVATVLVVACQSDSGPVAPLSEGPALTITDAAHNDGNPRFHFLPPLVKQPIFSGTPDGAVAPQVLVCQWDGNQCADLVAAFDENEGTGGEVIRYDPST